MSQKCRPHDYSTSRFPVALKELRILARHLTFVTMSAAMFFPIFAFGEDDVAFDYVDVWLNPAWYVPKEEIPRGSDVFEVYEHWRSYPKKIVFSSFFNRVTVDDTSCKYEELGIRAAKLGAGRLPTLSINCPGFKQFFVQKHQTIRGRHKSYFINVEFTDTGKTTSEGYPFELVGYYRESYFKERMKLYELDKQKDDPELKDWGSQ